MKAPLLDRLRGRAAAHRAKDTGDHLFDADLLDEAANALCLGEWQSIETAPKDGTSILAGWPHDGHREITSWDRSANQWVGAMSGFWKEEDWPPLWQPLPAPPKP